MSGQNNFNMCAQSSPSSEGYETHNGTPATKLTEYSPDDVRRDAKTASEVCAVTSDPPLFALEAFQTNATSKLESSTQLGTVAHDPFSSDSGISMTFRSSRAPKLSPTAKDFKPRTSSACKPHNSLPMETHFNHSHSGETHSPVTTAVGYLRATSVPDMEETSLISRNSSSVLLGNQGTLLAPIGAPPPLNTHVSATTPCSPNTQKRFPIRNGSRYIQISGVAKTATIDDLNKIFNVTSFNSDCNNVLADTLRHHASKFPNW